MKLLSLSILLSLIIFSSCQQQKTEDPNSDKPFIISNSWMRPGVANRNSAAFAKITNNTDIADTLFAVSSDLAKVVEIHETFSKENDMKGMRHIDFIVIPGNSIVELEPGGFHIMLIGLNKDLKKGDGGMITFNFKNTGDVDLSIKVK